jgi:hypothetical protein
MNGMEYNQKLEFLQSVLTDAKERADYHLEFDTIETISELHNQYQGTEMK